MSAKPENLELIGPADDRGYSKFNRIRGLLSQKFGMTHVHSPFATRITLHSSLSPRFFRPCIPLFQQELYHPFAVIALHDDFAVFGGAANPTFGFEEFAQFFEGRLWACEAGDEGYCEFGRRDHIRKNKVAQWDQKTN